MTQLSHLAGCECWIILWRKYLFYYRLVCVHSPERDDALVSVCLSVCLILPLAFWGHCVVVRVCSAAQGSIPKLPPALFSLHHKQKLQLTIRTLHRFTHIHSVSVHVALAIIWNHLYSPYDAAVPAVFILSVISTSKRQIQGLTVFRCSRPPKMLLHVVLNL